MMRSRVQTVGWLVAMTAAVTAPSAAASSGHASHSDASRVIVQFEPGTGAAGQRAALRAAHATPLRDLHVIHGLEARVPAGGAARLARAPGVRAVTPNSAMRSTGLGRGGRWDAWDPSQLATSFVQSTRTDKAWTDPRSPITGAGVTVAVVDTGVAGQLPDFRTSDSDPASRVVASVVTNPDATTATDVYGHGTHVAGLIAGNGRALPSWDPLYNRYIGTAPQARLVSVKASDDDGNASVADVIAGLQFVADHGADYGIRVVNLSMSSAVPMSYRVDPLDAAVEAVWSRGVIVVAAAGNRGTDADAVSYAPANDPYVITVGAVDDQGTKSVTDDTLAPWSSRGVTQDGFTKPDVVAPGVHIVAPLAPGSDFASLCSWCVVDGRYFQLSGTSMAAPVVAGIVADVLTAHPQWTPDQLKGALTYNPALLDADALSGTNVPRTADGTWEVDAGVAQNAPASALRSNENLVPSSLLDPVSGWMDETRASWGRASWKSAGDTLRASWGAASWACECAGQSQAMTDTRASWGRASWKAFFGDSPSDYGELGGGMRGAAGRQPRPSKH